MEMDYETDYSEKTSEYAPWNMSYIDRVQYKLMRLDQIITIINKLVNREQIQTKVSKLFEIGYNYIPAF